MNTYTALLSQTESNIPNDTVLDGIPGNPITWSRLGVGIYRGTPAVPFDVQKTAVMIGSNNGGRYLFNAFIDWEEEVGTIIVQSLLQDPSTKEMTYTDNALYNSALTIEQRA